MYSAGIPVTSTSMTSQEQGSHLSHQYEPFRSAVIGFSGLSQFASGSRVSGICQPPVPPLTSTPLFPQSSAPSYQQSSQERYRSLLQQQAASHLPYTMQTNVPSNTPAYNTTPCSYGQTKPLGRTAQQSYQGSASPFFPQSVPPASVTNVPVQPPGISVAPGPSQPPQVHFAFGAQGTQQVDRNMYEHSIHTVTSAKHNYPSLQQSMNPSPPLLSGPQSGWALGGNTARRSPQTSTMPPPTSDYLPPNRQAPVVSGFVPGPPASATAKSYPPRLCHILKGPGYTPYYGFTCKTWSDGPYIEGIEKGSSADTAGLREKDKIIEINGFNVENEANDGLILEKMRGLPNEMKMFVMDKVTHERLKSSGIKITSSLPMVVHMKSRPLSPGMAAFYQRQSQQPQAMPPIHPSVAAAADPTVPPQHVPIQRPIMCGEQTALTRINTEVHAPSNQAVITEPDDKKLLGQWYAQPATSQPTSAVPEKSTKAVGSQSSATNTAINATVSLRTTVAETSSTEAGSTEANIISSRNNTPDHPRTVEPNPGILQDKIFEMIRKGTPYSHFNDRNKPPSPLLNSDESTSVGTSYVGTSIANKDDLQQVTEPVIQEHSHTPPSQVNTNPLDSQRTAALEHQIDTDIDSKEGITLIHTEDNGSIIRTKDSTEKRNNRTGTVMRENETEQTANDVTPESISSIDLANQLDIDKNVAMSHLNMKFDFISDRVYAVNGGSLSSNNKLNSPPESTQVSCRNFSETPNNESSQNSVAVTNTSSTPQMTKEMSKAPDNNELVIESSAEFPNRAPEIGKNSSQHSESVAKQIYLSSCLKNDSGIVNVAENDESPSSNNRLTSLPGSTEVSDISLSSPNNCLPQNGVVVTEKSSTPQMTKEMIRAPDNSEQVKESSAEFPNREPEIVKDKPQQSESITKHKYLSSSIKTDSGIVKTAPSLSKTNTTSGKLNIEKLHKSPNFKNQAKKLKVRFGPPSKKFFGSESPTKKIVLTWKKKMAAKALLAEKEVEPTAEQAKSPVMENTGSDTLDKAPKKKKKKRTSSEALLNEESDHPPTKKRGRGKGRGRGRGRGNNIGIGKEQKKGHGSETSTETGRGKQIGRGRGRSRGQGLRVVAPPENMSWQDYFTMKCGSAGNDDMLPTVEVDVDEVVATPAVEQDSPGGLQYTRSDTGGDLPSSDQGQTNITDELITNIEERGSESLFRSVEETKVKVGTSDAEKSIAVRKTEGVLNFDSTELHTKDNLVCKTDKHTLSWVWFHGRKLLLINSEDGDYLVMKELVFEAFNPCKPEKSLQGGQYSQYKALPKTLKIQYIYQTKEKKLGIMYKPVGPEVFEIVVQLLTEKRVLHKKQPRLGVISLVDSLRLYHFITRVGTSECSDVHEQCVKPFNNQSTRERKPVDLIYPISSNETSSSLKTERKENHRKPNKGSKIDTNSNSGSAVSSNNAFPGLEKSNTSKPAKAIEVPQDVIEISSDEESCHSDSTIPYINGAALSDIGDKFVISDSETQSSDKNAAVTSEIEEVHEEMIQDAGQSSLSEAGKEIPSSETLPSIIKEAMNTSDLAEPRLQVAPQSLNTFLLMDSMTVKTESGNSSIESVDIELSAVKDLNLDARKDTELSGTKDLNSDATKETSNKISDTKKVEYDLTKSSGEIEKMYPTKYLRTKYSENIPEKSNENNVTYSIADRNLESKTSSKITDRRSRSKSDDDVVDQSLLSGNGVSDNFFKEKSDVDITDLSLETNAKTLIITKKSETNTNSSDSDVTAEVKTTQTGTTSLLLPYTDENSEVQKENKEMTEGSEVIENAKETCGTSTSSNASQFKGVKEFFNVDDDDYNYQDDDDITLIDIDGYEEQLLDEGDRRIDELVELRNKAETEEEIEHAWTQALKFQRPLHTLQKAILEAYEKDRAHIEEIEALKQENEELKKFVEQHKEFLNPIPECDRVIGNIQLAETGE